MDDAPARARTAAFKRNPDLEALLILLEGPLAAAGSRLTADLEGPARPIVFVVGCARSGSTLFMQLLANSAAFGYPSNFLSRFYAAPAVGAAIQKLLFDPTYQYRSELELPGLSVDYTSDLGKTRGPLAPNDFLYFWRRWVSDEDGHAPRQMRADHAAELNAELTALARVFEHPLALKAQIVNWALPALFEHVPDAYFVFVRRDRLFNAQSLLEARQRFFGTPDEWYSHKPKQYSELADLPPESQVAGQVVYTEREIAAALERSAADRVIEVSYEDLTSRPQGVWEQLATMVASHASAPDIGECPRVEPFASANTRRLPEISLDKIAAALASFEA